MPSCLPTRHMIFVHADMPEHIGAGRPNIIDDTLRALMHGASVPFAHLGNNRVTMRWNRDTMTPGLQFGRLTQNETFLVRMEVRFSQFNSFRTGCEDVFYTDPWILQLFSTIIPFGL